MKIYHCQSCGEDFRVELNEDVEPGDLYCPNCGTEGLLEEIRVDWVVAAGKIGEVGHCTRCGEGLEIQYPVRLDLMVAVMNQFCWEHHGCPADMKYEEPAIKTPRDWIESRDVGVSSIAIWTVLSGEQHPYLERGKSYHVRWSNEAPSDGADFGRCYRLLKRFPDWRPRLGEVAQRFPWWKPFVEGWDELTALYERAIADGVPADEQKKLGHEMYERLHQLEEAAKAPAHG